MPDCAVSRDLKFTSSALSFLTGSLATEPSAIFSPTKKKKRINNQLTLILTEKRSTIDTMQGIYPQNELL